MIEQRVFLDTWKALCRRFGRSRDNEEALEHHAYLSGAMTTSEFVKSARHVWATREFFPRPADFLIVAGGLEWAELIRIRAKDAAQTRPWANAYEQALSDRGRAAVKLLGGLDIVVGLYERDPIRARNEFLSAYELHAGQLAREHARIGEPKPDNQLPPPPAEAGRIVNELVPGLIGSG